MSQLETLCQQVWGAYQYLHDYDFAEQSGTSKRLRAGQPEKFKARLLEELEELRGVIEGTHFHEGFDSDIVLEGYEVWYWAVCLAISYHATESQLQPAVQFQAGFETGQTDRTALLAPFAGLIAQLETATDSQALLSLLPTVFYRVGQACALNGADPARLLERDASEMRQKAYLQPYWQEVEIRGQRSEIRDQKLTL